MKSICVLTLSIYLILSNCLHILFETTFGLPHCCTIWGHILVSFCFRDFVEFSICLSYTKHRILLKTFFFLSSFCQCWQAPTDKKVILIKYWWQNTTITITIARSDVFFYYGKLNKISNRINKKSSYLYEYAQIEQKRPEVSEKRNLRFFFGEKFISRILWF